MTTPSIPPSSMANLPSNPLTVATSPASSSSSNIDNTPPASTSSSTPSSASSSPTVLSPPTSYSWTPSEGLAQTRTPREAGNRIINNNNNNDNNNSPFERPSAMLHPLDSSDSHPLHLDTDVQQPSQDSYIHEQSSPTTPGEDMVFDRGLLFSSRRTPRSPDRQLESTSRPAPAKLVSAPLLPSHRPSIMPRSTSDSDFSGNSGNSNASTVRSAWSSANPNDSTRPREIRSTPIYMPVVHHPPPTPKMGQSSINTHLHPPRSPTHTSQGSSGLPSRTPSPNLSTRTLTSQRSQTHLSPNNAPTPQRSLSPFTSSSSLHQQYSSPTSALRPDSVCSYPDSSPLMAPNVLAAVDARLRANAAAATSSVTGGSSQVDLTSSPLNSRPLPFAQGSYSSQGSGMNSRASSVAPVMTHYSALHSSTGVKSREDLYDILNADDDEGGGRSGGGEDLHGGLGKPRPGFIHSSQSKRSSRCNSISSSLAGSGIELNAHHRRSQIDDAPILLTKPSRAKLAGNGTLSHKGSALTSSGSIVNGKREYHSGFEDSTTLNSSPELAPYLERSAWLKSKTKTSRKWRGICCGIGILIFLGAIAGITFGFISGKGKVDGLAPPPDPERPNNKPNPPITQFKPDPNLRKAFYGLDYNPANGLMPWCGATLQSVINDIILMSQLTSRIRLYGMDCNQADLTFQAINALNLNSTMKVVLTVWVDKNATTYQRQYDTLFKVLDTYGTSMVQGISVGNEVLFQGYKTLTELGVLMKDVRTQIKTRYNADIPIFTSDIGNNVNSSLAAVSDELHGNLHPYFSDSKIENAANWTLAQYEERIEGNPTSSGRKGAISEVGWPSAPSSAVYKTNAVPSVANLQTMIDTFICQANAAGIPYYWFEFKDEPWKTDPKVPVEPYWGLFDKDGRLKVKIPDCKAP